MATTYTEIPINHAATPASAAAASSSRRARFSSKLRMLAVAGAVFATLGLLVAYAVPPTRARAVASDVRRSVTLTLPSLFAGTKASASASASASAADAHVARQMSTGHMLSPVFATSSGNRVSVFGGAVGATGPAPIVRATGPAPMVRATGPAPFVAMAAVAAAAAAATGPAPMVRATGPAPMVRATGPAPFVAMAATGPAPIVRATGPAPVVAGGNNVNNINPAAAIAFGMAGPMSGGVAATTTAVRNMGNACAVEAHSPCVGTVTSSAFRAVRQCAVGTKASECRCLGRMAKLSNSGLVGPHCMCEYETSRPGSATWAMYLSCTKA